MSFPSLPRKYNFVAVYGDYFWGVTLYFSVDLLMTLDPLHSLRSVLMEGKLLVSFFFAEICRIKGRSQDHNEAGLHSHPSHVQSQWLNTYWKKRIGVVHVLTWVL